MIVPSGKFIVHDMGSSRVIEVSESFFGSCRRRIYPILLDSTDFQPWMSSEGFSKQIIALGMLPSFIKPESKIDFRPEFLKSFGELCSTSETIDVFRHDAGIKRHTIDFDVFKCQRKILVFEKAIFLTNNWKPWQKILFEKILKSIIPIIEVDGDFASPLNFSHRDCIGATFHSVLLDSPFPDLSLNISFAHELGHQVLFIYEQSGMLNFESEAPLYSGIRKTSRPPRNVLHAAVALSYMIECIRGLIGNEKKMIVLVTLNRNWTSI